MNQNKTKVNVIFAIVLCFVFVNTVAGISFDHNGGSQTTSISVTYEYGIISKPSWVTVSPSSGWGNTTLTITCSANSSSSARSGTIVIGRASQSNISISVSQSGVPISNYTVTASAGSGGSIGPSSQSVSYGGSALFTVSPNTGYYVSGCSGGSLSGNTVTVSNVTSNRSVSVSFSNLYTVSASAGLGGSVSPSSQTVSYGSSAYVVASPNAGYEISGVSGGTLDVDDRTIYISSVTSNRNISVSFNPLTFTVNASTGSGGTISPSQQTVDYGGSTSFTVTPNTGHYISAYSGGTLSGNTLTVTNVKSNKSVSASFTPYSYTVSASAGTGGSISPLSRTVDYGESTTFTITPSSGYIIGGVTGGTLSGNTLTVNNVTGNRSVSVSFYRPEISGYVTVDGTGISGATIVLSDNDGPTSTTTAADGLYRITVPYNWTGSVNASKTGYDMSDGQFFSYLTSNTSANFTGELKTYIVSASAGSGGSISPTSTTVSHGGSKTFLVTPETGYYIVGCTGGSLNGNEIIVSNVTSNRSVSVSFAPYTYYISGTVKNSSGVGLSGATVTLSNGGGTTTTNSSGGFTTSVQYGWSGNISASLNGYTISGSHSFTNVTENKTANFTALEEHTITATAGNNGSISPSGSFTVADGSDQSFHITPNEGYEIDTYNTGSLNGNVLTLNNITSDKSVSVTFKLSRLTIAGSVKTSGGSPISGAYIDITDNDGPTNTTTNSNGDYSISVPYNWSGNVVASKTGYTMSTVPFQSYLTSDVDLDFTATIKEYNISASSGTGGSISPNGNQTVEHGESISFTITSNDGYHISDVEVDNSSVGAVSQYSFNNVTSNHSIESSFELTPPSGVSATALSSTSIQVNWSAVSSALNVNEYIVYKSSSPAGSYSSIEGVSNTSYIDEGLNPNETWYYKIAVFANGETSELSDYASSTTLNTPAVPSSVSASSDSSSVTLVSWSSVPNADGYEVFQRNNTSGIFESIGTTSSSQTSLRVTGLQPVTSYAFKVTAVNINGSSEMSSAATVTTVPAPPSISAEVNSSSKITVSWPAVTGSGTVQQYVLYKLNGSIGQYEAFGDIYNPNTLYEDTGLTPESTHSYKVRVQTNLGVSELSSAVSATTLKTYTITTNVGSNGSLNPNGIITVDEGSDQLFIVTPNEGYKLDEYSCGVISNDTLVVYNILSDTTISVSFSELRILISGYVKNSTEEGIGDVYIDISDSDQETSTTTDSTGYYSISVPYNWSGNVVASKTGYTMSTVPFQSYLTSDVSLDFTATRLAPEAPTGLSQGEVTPTSIQIVWDSVEDADYYIIDTLNLISREYDSLATTENTNYIFTNLIPNSSHSYGIRVSVDEYVSPRSIINVKSLLPEPVITEISVNNNEEFCFERKVFIKSSINFEDFVGLIYRISEDSLNLESLPFDKVYTDSIAFYLDDFDGTHTIFLQFQDTLDRVSDVAALQIYLQRDYMMDHFYVNNPVRSNSVLVNIMPALGFDPIYYRLNTSQNFVDIPWKNYSSSDSIYFDLSNLEHGVHRLYCQISEDGIIPSKPVYFDIRYYPNLPDLVDFFIVDRPDTIYTREAIVDFELFSDTTVATKYQFDITPRNLPVDFDERWGNISPNDSIIVEIEGDEGDYKIWFQIQDQYGQESDTLSYDVTLVLPEPIINDFYVNDSSGYTLDTLLTLYHSITSDPAIDTFKVKEYRYSINSDITQNENWLEYDTLITHAVDSIGTYIVEFQVRTEDKLSEIVRDTIIVGSPFFTFWSVDEEGNISFSDGNVGVGSNDVSRLLTVKGKILSEELRVNVTEPQPDYVFEEGYKLSSLNEIETYIKNHKHLSEIPSAEEVKNSGLTIGKMNSTLLKKIEELTLLIIEQNKRIERLKSINNSKVEN